MEDNIKISLMRRQVLRDIYRPYTGLIHDHTQLTVMGSAVFKFMVLLMERLDSSGSRKDLRKITL
jgi:hypothetical protein